MFASSDGTNTTQQESLLQAMIAELFVMDRRGKKTFPHVKSKRRTKKKESRGCHSKATGGKKRERKKPWTESEASRGKRDMKEKQDIYKRAVTTALTHLGSDIRG